MNNIAKKMAIVILIAAVLTGLSTLYKTNTTYLCVVGDNQVTSELGTCNEESAGWPFQAKGNHGAFNNQSVHSYTLPAKLLPAWVYNFILYCSTASIIAILVEKRREKK